MAIIQSGCVIEPRLRVLVADDEPDVRTVVQEFLAGYDCEILEAENGQRAMSILESTSVGLLIVDICMPERDGLEMLRELQRQPVRPRILVISGAFDGLFLRAARLLGADAILDKPFSEEQLIATLDTLLGAGWRASKSPAQQSEG